MSTELMHLPLAVSQARDGKIQTPHRVVIDHADWPVAVVYGNDDADAELKARLFVKRVNTHELLVHELQAVRDLMPDISDALALAGSE